MKLLGFLIASTLTLTCDHSGLSAQTRPARPTKPSARAPVSASASAALPAVMLPEAPRRGIETGPLAHFFSELERLSAGERREHVRVLWLGDSHTAADYFPGAVRTSFAARFGDGGPGFVRIGTKPYRHDGLRVQRDGAWNVDPDSPARRKLQDDGVFGLGGTRAVPGVRASFSVELSRNLASEDADARFELQYVLPAGSSFVVELGGRRFVVDAARASERASSGISHLELRAPLSSRLLILPRRGAPRLFGVVIERVEPPGFVLDTAGIDGARLETPLAWNEPAFVAEVERRDPALFVLAYGTNEAFDALRVSAYAGQLEKLVARLRRGAPRASCLVLGPTDVPLGEGSLPRVAEVASTLEQAASALGCAFADLQQLMGGEGSFLSGLRDKDRLAQPDLLHLTPKGYHKLGQALAKRLLDAYSAGSGDLPQRSNRPQNGISSSPPPPP